MSLVRCFVLLLCACCVYSQDFLEPSVNILTEIAKIKSLEERLKSAEETLQRQSNVVTELTSTLRDVMNENAVLKTTVHTLQGNVETMQNANEARKVAFSASLFASETGHEGPYESVESPLIYKKVVTNYGNGYDSNTGIFTAPIKGVYYLRFFAHSHADTRMAVSLYKNGNVECSVFVWKPPSNANAGNAIVLTLEKGDQIFTKLWQDSWVYDDPAGYTSFGGFLLFPL